MSFPPVRRQVSSCTLKVDASVDTLDIQSSAERRPAAAAADDRMKPAFCSGSQTDRHFRANYIRHHQHYIITDSLINIWNTNVLRGIALRSRKQEKNLGS